MGVLWKVDPVIADAIYKEVERQAFNLEMIASENFVSEGVLEAQASVLTNKYAEGYPGKRYYGGCKFIDIVEYEACERAKKLFNAEYANVQTHSGSQANIAVYFTIMEPGDTILGMDLTHGGHLTHGSRVNYSGKLFKTCFYGVQKETELIDYEQVLSLAREHKPKLIIAGASAYPRIIDFEKFHQIAQEVGSYLMVDMAHIGGLIAGGVHPSPVPYADFITSTTHKTLRGPRGGLILCKKTFGKKLDKTVMPGIQGGPLMHIIAAKAVCFLEAMQPSFKEYTKKIVENAKILGEELKNRGFRLVTGGTDNHLILIDLSLQNITGNEAELALEEAGIIANKNSIPYDTKGLMVTSGVRFGTPALTSRGMGTEEMKKIAEMISRVLYNIKSEKLKTEIKAEIKDMCRRFPIYSNRVADSEAWRVY
ncbi:MAG TPA: serine hydroxymethyltransferase [Candidatus Eremiobacteraeota bacterium]|nr:serine hydroxymethyltransferase [Candidatus Eremiobacteraeota bacterium]